MNDSVNQDWGTEVILRIPDETVGTVSEVIKRCLKSNVGKYFNYTPEYDPSDSNIGKYAKAPHQHDPSNMVKREMDGETVIFRLLATELLSGEAVQGWFDTPWPIGHPSFTVEITPGQKQTVEVSIRYTREDIFGALVQDLVGELRQRWPSEARHEMDKPIASIICDAVDESILLEASPEAPPEPVVAEPQQPTAQQKRRPRGGPQPTPDEKKLEIVQGWLDARGRELQENYCCRVGVGVSTLSSWRRQLEAEGKLAAST